MVVISATMSAVATRVLIRYINALHLISLDSMMTIEEKGVKSEEELAPTSQGALLLFTQLPTRVLLGKWASAKQCMFSETRKLAEMYLHIDC